LKEEDYQLAHGLPAVNFTDELTISVALPSMYCAVRAWFMRTTVTAASGLLVFEKSILGVGWKRKIDSRIIDSIDVSSSAESGGSASYALSMVIGGSKTGFGSYMHSRSEAEHIQKLLLKAMDADKSASVP
jgi:hypothetical protein